MVFIDPNGSIGIITTAITTNITGYSSLTYLFISIVIIAFMLVFRIPIELALIFTLPFLIVMMAFDSFFLAIGGAALILTALVFARLLFSNT